MPITAFYDNTLTLHCARCGGTQEVPLDLLVVGILREATVEPLTIALPPCPACNGARLRPEALAVKIGRTRLIDNALLAG